MKMRDNMDLDVDYKVRAVAVQEETLYMPAHQRIFYGLNAVDLVGTVTCPVVFDVVATYGALSNGGRRSGNAIENERQQHFFNKRIMTDEERRQQAAAYAPVRSGPDTDSVRTRHSFEGVQGTSKLGEPREGAGGGAGDTNKKYFYDGHGEEITEEEYNATKQKQEVTT